MACFNLGGLLVIGDEECQEEARRKANARRRQNNANKADRREARNERQSNRQARKLGQTLARTDPDRGETPLEAAFGAHGERAAGLLGGFFGTGTGTEEGQAPAIPPDLLLIGGAVAAAWVVGSALGSSK